MNQQSWNRSNYYSKIHILVVLSAQWNINEYLCRVVLSISIGHHQPPPACVSTAGPGTDRRSTDPLPSLYRQADNAPLHTGHCNWESSYSLRA